MAEYFVGYLQGESRIPLGVVAVEGEKKEIVVVDGREIPPTWTPAAAQDILRDLEGVLKRTFAETQQGQPHELLKFREVLLPNEQNAPLAERAQRIYDIEVNPFYQV